MLEKINIDKLLNLEIENDKIEATFDHDGAHTLLIKRRVGETGAIAIDVWIDDANVAYNVGQTDEDVKWWASAQSIAFDRSHGAEVIARRKAIKLWNELEK